MEGGCGVMSDDSSHLWGVMGAMAKIQEGGQSQEGEAAGLDPARLRCSEAAGTGWHCSLLTAPHRTLCLEEEQKSDLAAWQVQAPLVNFSVGLPSLRAQNALIIKVIYKVCCFIHPPPLLLLAPHTLCCWGVSQSWEVLMYQSTPIFLAMSSAISVWWETCAGYEESHKKSDTEDKWLLS